MRHDIDDCEDDIEFAEDIASLEHQAALRMIREGWANVGETAKLRGCSRQTLQKQTRDDKPRERREERLRRQFTQIIDEMRGELCR